MKKNNASATDLFQFKMMLIGMVNVLVLSAMLGIQGAGYLGITLWCSRFLPHFSLSGSPIWWQNISAEEIPETSTKAA